MEVHLTKEQESALNEILNCTGRPTDQLVADALSRFIEHEVWFASSVKEGLAALDRGEGLENDEVIASIEAIFRR
jgi:predicted transcriptional regulator